MTRFAKAKVVLPAVLALSVIAPITGMVGAAPAPKASKVTNWTFIIFSSASDPHAIQYTAFAKEVLKDTHGALNITVSPPGQLPYSLPQFLQAVGSGGAQMADSFSAGVGGESSILNIMGSPGLYASYGLLAKAMNAVQPYLTPQLKQYGDKMLWWYDYPNAEIFGSGTAPSSEAAFKGMNIRSTGSGVSAYETQLGAVPVTLSTPQVAASWAHGVINANWSTPISVVGSGWTSFAQWEYQLNAGVNPSVVVVNQKALNALSPSVRKAFLKDCAKQQALWKSRTTTLNNAALSQLTSGGMTVVTPPASLLASLRTVIQSYLVTFAKANGVLPALKAMNNAMGVKTPSS